MLAARPIINAQAVISTALVPRRNCLCLKNAKPEKFHTAFFKPSQYRSGRRTLKVAAGLFDLFSPSKSGKNSTSRATELVDDLIELTQATKGGLNASKSRKEEIAELVAELEQFCPRAPLRSPELWGEWEVSYASNPTATGGPFLRGPVGQVALPGQELRQFLEQPGTVKNFVTFKALGFLPGKSCQVGDIEPIDGKTYRLVLLPPTRKFDSSGEPITSGEPNLILEQQIVYLDDRVRCMRLISAEKEGEEEEYEEEIIVVFKRPGAQVVAEEAYEEEESVPPAVRSGGTGLFSGLKLGGTSAEGLATRAERAYYNKRGVSGEGEAPKGLKSISSKGRRAGSRVVNRKEDAAQEAAAEARRKAAEEAAALKSAIQNQLRELKEGAREASAEAKAAINEFKSFQRSSQPAIRSAMKTLSQISALRDEGEEVAEQLAQMRAQEQEAAQQVKDTTKELRELEKLVGLKA